MELGRNTFAEGKDLELIETITKDNLLCQMIKQNKDVYLQMAFEESPQLFKLICEGKLGAGVRINQKNKTLVFLDEDEQEKMHLVQEIESNNLRLVDVLEKVKQTKDQVVTSQAYAKAMVKKKGHDQGKLKIKFLFRNFVNLDKAKDWNDERAL